MNGTGVFEAFSIAKFPANTITSAIDAPVCSAIFSYTGNISFSLFGLFISQLHCGSSLIRDPLAPPRRSELRKIEALAQAVSTISVTVKFTFERCSFISSTFISLFPFGIGSCHIKSSAGTSGPRDFIELPSQLLEHWASEPEVLKSFAKHYETGESIPDELIEKILKASKFNQGFINTEYLAASLLDMDWHTISYTDPLKDSNE